MVWAAWGTQGFTSGAKRNSCRFLLYIYFKMVWAGSSTQHKYDIMYVGEHTWDVNWSHVGQHEVVIACSVINGWNFLLFFFPLFFPKCCLSHLTRNIWVFWATFMTLLLVLALSVHIQSLLHQQIYISSFTFSIVNLLSYFFQLLKVDQITTMHNGELMKFWGPLIKVSKFSGERHNGALQKIKTNSHLCKKFFNIFMT